VYYGIGGNCGDCDCENGFARNVADVVNVVNVVVVAMGLSDNKPLAFSHQPLVNTEAFASLLCRRCRKNDNR